MVGTRLDCARNIVSHVRGSAEDIAARNSTHAERAVVLNAVRTVIPLRRIDSIHRLTALSLSLACVSWLRRRRWVFYLVTPPCNVVKNERNGPCSCVACSLRVRHVPVCDWLVSRVETLAPRARHVTHTLVPWYKYIRQHTQFVVNGDHVRARMTTHPVCGVVNGGRISRCYRRQEERV